MPSVMNRRIILWSAAGTVGLAGALFGVWLLSLPSAKTVAEAPPLATDETEATLSALKAPKRDVADAVLLATAPGPVKLYPAAFR